MADLFTLPLRAAQRMRTRTGLAVDLTSLQVEPPHEPGNYKASGYWIAGRTVCGRELTVGELDELGRDYPEALYEASLEACRG